MDDLDRINQLLIPKPNDKEDEDRNFDQASDLLMDIDPLSLTQDNFIRYLDLARRLAWDIPSAISCNHPIGENLPMHRIKSYGPPNIWTKIDLHFLTVHRIRLDDSRINWNFDT